MVDKNLLTFRYIIHDVKQVLPFFQCLLPEIYPNYVIRNILRNFSFVALYFG